MGENQMPVDAGFRDPDAPAPPPAGGFGKALGGWLLANAMFLAWVTVVSVHLILVVQPLNFAPLLFAVFAAWSGYLGIRGVRGQIDAVAGQTYMVLGIVGGFWLCEMTMGAGGMSMIFGVGNFIALIVFAMRYHRRARLEHRPFAMAIPAVGSPLARPAAPYSWAPTQTKSPATADPIAGALGCLLPVYGALAGLIAGGSLLEFLHVFGRKSETLTMRAGMAAAVFGFACVAAWVALARFNREKKGQLIAAAVFGLTSLLPFSMALDAIIHRPHPGNWALAVIIGAAFLFFAWLAVAHRRNQIRPDAPQEFAIPVVAPNAPPMVMPPDAPAPDFAPPPITPPDADSPTAP